MPSSLAAPRRRPARTSSRKPTNRLGVYLAAGLGATTGITATSDAAIVNIDIGPTGFNIGGVNAGLPSGGYGGREDFPATQQGTLAFFNNFVNPYDGYRFTGLGGSYGLTISDPGFGIIGPRNFGPNQMIDGTAGFTDVPFFTMFRYSDNGGTRTAPDFGPNSYMGFKTALGNFGYLEVTWSAATSQFQILSGAYESVPGVGIITPVPEPSTVALGGVGALVCGGAALRRWRKQKRA